MFPISIKRGGEVFLINYIFKQTEVHSTSLRNSSNIVIRKYETKEECFFTIQKGKYQQ